MPGEAGALPDIHVFSVPKQTWDHSSAAIIQLLRHADGILRVDVQEPRTRAKRGKLDGPFALPHHVENYPSRHTRLLKGTAGMAFSF
jgi:hypothetical protein